MLRGDDIQYVPPTNFDEAFKILQASVDGSNFNVRMANVIIIGVLAKPV